MDCGFERLCKKAMIGLLSVFVAVALWFCNTAEAYIYGHLVALELIPVNGRSLIPFTSFPNLGMVNSISMAIIPRKFPPRPVGFLFRPRPLSLVSSAWTLTNLRLQTFRRVVKAWGRFAALGLGTKSSKYARMLRGRVVSGQWGYFEANYFDGALLHVWYVFADATSGRLGLYYDGSAVSFYYNNGVDGWQRLDTSGPDTHGNIVAVTPGWLTPTLIRQRDPWREWSDQLRSGQSRIHTGIVRPNIDGRVDHGLGGSPGATGIHLIRWKRIG